MHYFKLLLIFVGLLMLTSPPVLAENWVEVVGADNKVYIDSDSILSDGNYLFYNIKYYEPKAREDLIVTVQARENSAGIVKTCPVSKYNKDKTINNININKINNEISQLADNEKIFFIDVNEKFDDENGNLSSNYTQDNVHIYAKYYKEWSDWLSQNAVK